MRTLCDVTGLDEVGETLSVIVAAGGETLGTIVGDSTVGIPEPCPIDWFVASNTTMLRTGALCFKRISLAGIESNDQESSSENITTNPWYMYTSDRLQLLLHWWKYYLWGWLIEIRYPRSNKHRHGHHSYQPRASEFDRLLQKKIRFISFLQWSIETYHCWDMSWQSRDSEPCWSLDRP